MRRWIILVGFLCIFLSMSVALWAQGNNFTPSPHIYKIVAADCEAGPAERVQSGFRVKDQVGIVTALHGLLGCTSIVASPGGDGQTFQNLMIGKVDIRHDVAVLWSKELADEPLVGLVAITDTLTIDVDETYQVVGYPFGLFRQKPTIDVKILERTPLGNLLNDEAINLIADRDSPGIDVEVLSVQTHLVPGHSGAPILNRQEQVVGIGNGGLDLGRVEMGWAMPWDGIDPQAVSSRVSQTVSWSDYRRLRQLQSSSADLIFVYSTPEPLTITSTVTIPSTAQAVIDLRVVDEGLTENTYYIEGKQVSSFAIGDDLIVYAEPNPGIEIAVALLKVVGKSSTSLTAQAILIDPRYDIRARMRIDNNLGHLSESQLIPVFDYVEGYLLRPTRIRLRLDHELTVGAQLQALAYEYIGEAIVDALPMEPPVQLQITNLGIDGQIAVVKLLTGEWPITGTIVSLLEIPTPSPTVAPQPTATFTVKPVQTSTPLPPPTEPATPTPRVCRFEPGRTFYTIYQVHSQSLGCPISSQITVSTISEEMFQGGHLFWRKDTDIVYIIYDRQIGGGELFSGTWDKSIDPVTGRYWSWAQVGEPDPDGIGLVPPSGLLEPKRGFGWLWRTHLGQENGRLGWALDVAYGFDNVGQAQEFEQGTLFKGSDPKIYVLLNTGQFYASR